MPKKRKADQKKSTKKPNKSIPQKDDKNTSNDKDKQFKAIESPIQKKTFEEQIQKEFKAKEERIYNLKTQKEKTIRDNVLAASKAIAASKKLDVILDYGVVYAGGVDVTNDIIQYLNTQKK